MRDMTPNNRIYLSAVVLIAAVAGFTGLKLAEDVVAPLVFGLVSGVILAPVSDWFDRRGLPRALVALTVLLFSVVFLAGIAFLLEPVIWRLVDELPRIRWEIRQTIYEFRGLIQGIDEVNAEMKSALGAEPGIDAGDGDAADRLPTVTDALLMAPLLLAQAVIFMGTLFFFLLTRTGIYRWISQRLGARADTPVILERFCAAESRVSRYFLTITLVNAGLGAALSLALMSIGMPSPFIWGFVAALLNYVLYIGPAAMAASLLLAGLVVFDGLASLLPPVIFLTLNLIEANFVTPSMVGRHVAVNPLLVFVSLVFWLWLWGPLGGIVAIPILVATLALFDVFGDNPMS
ncbi:AI-2E family transporter [Maritimibacter sp. 55A14]|uniref:AI-2E family transporter n=1 Tax=Maritimibacter sp. 55A14 TaxID=2174844 RepID=UPI000D61CDD3|nr:AI-2E family transporter [Maritimibacter sp. 55A14]PWE33481.1 AI-2E family transporter [Maritimibacter sp. 55A14]